MKRSKLLQNSKDMLSRSFNPAKCKTSLRLAGSRLKLLRNKKEVQVKQMKREIAQLLESGQDQTARIRVEHVVREEKMMAAYDLLEIYCELLVARLPIIESQKNCPIDLKEAIASVIFASPRCGDVPELLDVRKHFSAKYGKEFTTAAIELRPQCGVARLLVEKLSATAPDGQTKIKILGAIAEEHNVKWYPKSYEEENSGVPSSIRKESEMYAETPHFEAADIQDHLSNDMHNSQLNFDKQDSRISPGTEKLSSAQTPGASTTFQTEAGPPGNKTPQLFQGDGHNSHLDRQRWNMEFKDATSAAQAAADSAERASMAARAAAEFASHGRNSRQYPTEVVKSNVHISEDEGLRVAPNLNSSERFSEASTNRLSSEHTNLENTHIDGIKPSNSRTSMGFEEGGGGGSEEYSQSASLKSKASANDESLYHDLPFMDEHIQKNTLKEVSKDEINMKKQPFSYETETANCGPEKAGNPIEGMIAEQKSLSSARSQSSISDDVNVFAFSEDQKSENNAGDDPFMSISTGVHGEATQTSSHESAALFFDKSDSDSDDHGLDRGPTYDDQELEFHLSSLDQKSAEPLSINTDSWSPRTGSSNIVKSASPPLSFTREKLSHDFSEKTTPIDDSEPDNFAPVTFDDSDGLTSESDEDTNDSNIDDSRDHLRERNERGQSDRSPFEDETGQSVGSPFKNGLYSVSESKQLSLSSDDELNLSKAMNRKRNQVNIFDADSPEKSSLLRPSVEQPALGFKDSEMESKNIGNDSSAASGERLNFGKLTGGFLHKGSNRLPVFKNRLDVSSSVKKEAETSATVTSSTSPFPVERSTIGKMLEPETSSSTPQLQSESDSDSSDEEESLRKSSGQKQALGAVEAVKTKSTLRASNSIFGSDDSDLDKDSQRESLTRKSHLRGGISRRTKAAPSAKISYSKMSPRSEELDSDGVGRKSTTSYNSENPKKSESHRKMSGKWETYEQPISAEVASMTDKSNFWELRDSAEETPVIKQESKTRLKYEARNSDESLGKKPSKFDSLDHQQEFQPLSRNSSQLGNSEKQTPGDVASKPTNSSSRVTPPEKAASKRMQESKISQKSSAVEQTQQNSDTPITSENPKTATLHATSLDKDDSTKKPSHVHPKLPDYDTLLQSLRMNRS